MNVSCLETAKAEFNRHFAGRPARRPDRGPGLVEIVLVTDSNQVDRDDLVNIWGLDPDRPAVLCVIDRARDKSPQLFLVGQPLILPDSFMGLPVRYLDLASLNPGSR